MFRFISLLLLLNWAPAYAGTTSYPGVGRPATPAEIKAWDIDVRPDFQGLPPGSGDREHLHFAALPPVLTSAMPIRARAVFVSGEAARCESTQPHRCTPQHTRSSHVGHHRNMEDGARGR